MYLLLTFKEIGSRFRLTLDLGLRLVNISRLLSEKFPEEMKDRLPRKTVWNLMFCIGTAAVVSVFAAIYILKQVINIKSNL